MNFFAIILAACAAAAQFVGHICTPGSPGKHPAIILLGGSEGGDMMQNVAPQFASRGFVAASVAYFGAPGLPSELVQIPVETVGNAIAAVSARPDVDANKIAIFGVSKGGELSLLVASLYPQIHAVVAGVPSPFAWQAISANPSQVLSSWTYGGKPLPFVAYGAAMGQVFGQAFATHAPLQLRAGYEGSMNEHASEIAAAMFPLQNIRGPVLFVSGGEDGIWNSQQLSAMGLKYLRDHNHPYADRQLNYPDAGHLFLFAAPGRAMTSAPMGPFTLDLGGTPQNNVRDGADAWPKIMTFLDEALK